MTGGWIKFEKALESDPRVRKLARELRNACVTQGRFNKDDTYFSHAFFVSQVLGCLGRLWFYADTHIPKDDMIQMDINDVDEIVGVQGFAQILPEDWLQILDAETVKLPGFHTHNGTKAKKQAVTNKRVARFREKVALESYKHKRSCNADVTPDALPDQDQDQDQDQESITHIGQAAKQPDADPRETETQISEHMLEIKAIYPKAAREDWITGEKRARTLVLNGEASWVDLQAGTQRYAKHCKATGRIPLNPARFFGDVDWPWSQEWPIPAKPGRSAPPSDEAAWAEANALAQEIGFRNPHPGETASSYMHDVKWERDKPPPLELRRGLAGIGGKRVTP
jgi:hypothetical protein